MLRDDCTKSCWKENFINGLPNLFAHKIRDVLSQPTGIIEYDNLTYGDTISTIQKEGLKMCIDLKLSQKAAKDKHNVKYELGNFCEWYGLPLVALSRSKNNKKKSSYKYSTKYKKKYYPFKSTDKYYTKPKNKNYHKKSNQSQKSKPKPDVTCYNCGKKGHYSNKCKIKEKLKAKLNQLQITDENQQQILDIFKLATTPNQTPVQSL